MATQSCAKSIIQAMEDVHQHMLSCLYISMQQKICHVHIISQPPQKYYHIEWPYKGVVLQFGGGGGTGKGVLSISLAGEVPQSLKS